MGRLSLLLGEETDIWEKITDARKSPLKQAALVGFDTALLLLTGQLTLEKAETNIMKKLNFTGKAILCPYAEVGMDVDKLFQLELMREDLEKQVRKARRTSKKKDSAREQAPTEEVG